MSIDETTTVGTRVLTAFFDTEGAAKKAIDDLVAAGIPQQHISRTGGQDAEAHTSERGDHKGFWDELKDFFLPDDDRYSYAEGLRRGGYLVKVEADEANYSRVLDILDTDGAVNMDDRETEWRTAGWTGFSGEAPSSRTAGSSAAGLIAGTTLSAGANAPAVPSQTADAGASAYGTSRLSATTEPQANWRTDEIARAAALDGSVSAAAQAARTAVRDDGFGRTRLRSYSFPIAGEQAGQTGTFSAATDAALIVEHMEVISADGQSIGTVDHLDGPDRIKLAKTTSPDGQHHFVPFTWIDHVDQHVHLKRTLAEIKAGQ